MKTAQLTAFALAALTVLSAAGCASSSAAPDDGRIRIVASTDVYGNLAESIGGDLVDVTSIIDDPAQDPHSYEADARVQLAISTADVVIENGGGYDDFMTTLLDGADNPDATVLDATVISGYDTAEGFNEHVWYDFPTMIKVVDEIVTDLADRDPDAADTFQAAGDDIVRSLEELIVREAELKAAHDGTGVAITEPVPLYLLEAAGLVDRTPAEFSEAIEEGTDVAPAVLQQTLELLTAGTVGLLAYNEQTSGPETEKVKAAAEAAGVPVIGVTETLPEGEDYLSWMSGNLDAIEKALA